MLSAQTYLSYSPLDGITLVGVQGESSAAEQPLG